MRRAAKLLKIHRTTVERKLRFLANQARLSHLAFLERLKQSHCPIKKIQFDDMETFEHTKLKPLSITLAVTSQRKILQYEVSTMPAKGSLSAKSIRKYGRRWDGRRTALRTLLSKLTPFVCQKAVFESDQNPHYPAVLFEIFPHCSHLTTPGLRGCVTGQGELKAAAWDPLFALNHTAAMLRANINRLFRRTWCTTKIPQGLKDHLALYVQYHNHTLTA